MTISSSSIIENAEAAKKIIDFAGNATVLLFHGDMGAGKTTLIKSLCHALGSTDNITSPTFSIVNEYAAPKNIYHFDFYRIKNQSEASDIGCEEYFYSDNYCFIEWPENIPDLLPEHFLSIYISVMPDDSRNITLDKF